LIFKSYEFVESKLPEMLNTKVDHSFYRTYLIRPFDRFLTILLGPSAQRICPGHSRRNQHAVSIQIIGQIPQPHLSFDPDQTNGPYKEPPRPLRLHPKNMFHTTPNSGTRPIPLNLSIRQLLVLASFVLKMLPISI